MMKFTDNQEAQQFELTTEGHTAFIAYRREEGGRIALVHTEVPDALAGKGVGKTLVEQTLQYLRQQQLRVIPLCPFVAAYIKRHPEWASLVAAG